MSDFAINTLWFPVILKIHYFVVCCNTENPFHCLTVLVLLGINVIILIILLSLTV